MEPAAAGRPALIDPAPDGLLTGARCMASGFALIRRPGVRRYVLVPLAVNALLFAVALAIAARHVGALVERWLPAWLGFFAPLVWLLFTLVAVLVLLTCFTFVANLIGAPFNGLLAEAVERSLGAHRQDDAPLTWRRVAAQALSACASELRKLGYLAVRALPLVALSLIPGLQPIAAAAWMVFGAWALAIEYADYPLGNHGYDFPRQCALLAARRRTALGFGAAAAAFTMVPVLNFIAMPAAVAGATVMWHRVLRGAAA